VFTTEEAIAYCEQHKAGMDASLEANTGIPDWQKKHLPKSVWYAGCFLSAMLKKHGATQQEVSDIGFCHGQRCFHTQERGHYEWAVTYLNEYMANHTVADKPGVELADNLLREAGLL
jgi:1,6-anhydro-N-acetylmuramate kinase